MLRLVHTPRRTTLTVGLLIAACGAASAQAHVLAAAGALFPTGDFGAVAEAGPAAQGGVLFEVGGSGLSVGADAFYGRSAHATGSSRSEVYGAKGVLGYTLAGPGTVDLIVLMGAGALVHARRSSAFAGLDASRAGVAASVGLGATVPVGGVRGLLVASYTAGLGDVNSAAYPTALVMVAGGVSIPLG